MSVSYNIRVSASESRTVVVDDSVCSALELLEILPKEQMGGMLKAELEKKGFEEKDGIAVREKDGIEVSVDLAKGSVSIRLGDSKQVDVERERNTTTKAAPPEHKKVESALREQLQADIERAIEKEREGLRSEVTARLEKMLPELRREIDEAVNRVTVDALKIRAGQLGEIEEVTEDADGSVTIKVRT